MLIIEIFPVVLSVWLVSPCWLFKRACVISLKDPSAVSLWQNQSSMQKIHSGSTSVHLSHPSSTSRHWRPSIRLITRMSYWMRIQPLLFVMTSDHCQGFSCSSQEKWKFWEGCGSVSLNQSLLFLPLSCCLHRPEWEGWGERWGSWGRGAAWV